MTNPQVAIREFSFANDYDRTIAFWYGIEKGMNIGRSDTPEEIKKKLERDPELFLVAELEKEIIGTVIGAFDGRRGMIYHLAVHKDFRGQGIGAILLSEVEQRLQAKAASNAYCTFWMTTLKPSNFIRIKAGVMQSKMRSL
jgi:N-acetylglutamate synthase-like GNAT family acetyltransferase